MKIILHDYHGTPHHFDLSKELALRGHKVTHIYNVNSGGPHANFDEGKTNLKVIGINGKAVRKDSFIKRYLAEINYGKLAVNHIKEERPDVIISANTPTAHDIISG